MFTLDTEAAKTEDTLGSRIDKSGVYPGTITRAEWSKSATSQAEFFNIDFKDDEGKDAKYMNLIIKNKLGEKAFGYNILNRIMACCALRQLTSVPVGDKMQCPELTNMRVQFALQAEADWFKDKVTGEYKPTTNMIISVPFSAQSGQSAKEVLEQLPATAITTIVVSDRKPKDKPVDAGQQQYSGAPQMAPAYTPAPQQGGGNAADFETDDIPF